MPESSVEKPVELRRVGDTLVVALNGELDLYAALQCGPPIDRALAARPRRTVADLTWVTFMDCSGLALLVRMRRRTAHWGGEFVLHSPDPERFRILRYVDVGEPLRFVGALPGDGRDPGHPATEPSLP
ncbi:STAS domain-containing protein [Streptomyces sp. NPDC051561]|uniref:STAS domain-containing protein n=1 Tax=Streptomyces sp. NPDC051561 TaxID=3365658 RepID=UPI00379FF3D5